MKLPRDISPAAARRRALLVDVLLGLLIAVAAIIAAAGIGVVGVLGLLTALILVPWYFVDRLLRARRRHLDAPRRR